MGAQRRAPTGAVGAGRRPSPARRAPGGGPVVWGPRLVDRASIRERSRSCPPSPLTSPPPCPAPPGCPAAAPRRPRPSPRRRSRPRRTRSGGTAGSTSSTSTGSARPARPGAGDEPGPSPSERIHALVDGLGPRSGLVVTINGVLATLASTVGDDVVSLGRAADHAEGAALLGGGARPTPTTSRCSTTPSPSIRWWSTCSRRRIVADPVVVVHVVTGAAGGAVFPRTVVRAGAGAAAGVVEIVVDADTGLLAGAPTDLHGVRAGRPAERLVVPVTELQVADGAVARLRRRSSRSGSATWQLAHQASTIGADAALSSYAVALGGGYARLRTDSALVGESGASQPAGRLHRPRRPDARLPDPPGPPGPPDHERPAVHGGGRRHRPTRSTAG